MKKIRRIGKIVLIIIGWMVLFANALVFNNPTGWSLFLFFSGFLLLMLLSFLPSLKKVQFKTEKVQYTQVGQDFDLVVEVLASGFWQALFQVSIKELPTEAYQFFFYHGQPLTLTFPVPPLVRGRFEKPPIFLRGGDLFGLFEKEQRKLLPCTLYVLPKEDPLGRSLGQQLRQQFSQQTFGEPLPQVRSYRKYQPGDNHRQVDWKVSARQRTLTIREQETGQAVKPIFVFWGKQQKEFEIILSRYYAMQKELTGIQQYVIAQQVNLVTEEGVFAEITGFETLPPLPEWRNQDLVIFYGEADEILQQTVTNLRKYNRVSGYSLLTISSNNQPSRERW